MLIRLWYHSILSLEHKGRVFSFIFFFSMDEMMMKKEGEACGPGGCGGGHCGSGCRCPHHKVPSLLVTLFGLLFLLKALGAVSMELVDLLWPILVLLLGLTKLTSGKCKCY